MGKYHVKMKWSSCWCCQYDDTVKAFSADRSKALAFDRETAEKIAEEVGGVVVKMLTPAQLERNRKGGVARAESHTFESRSLMSRKRWDK